MQARTRKTYAKDPSRGKRGGRGGWGGWGGPAGQRMTVRVGILGAGNISDTHARVAQGTPGVEVVAYWGRNRERAARMAERYGGTAYPELEAFLRHRPMDAVLVGTPSGLHAQHAGAAAQRGLHVLVEKPLDVTTERIDALIDECDRARVKLGVIFQDRTAPHLVWLQGLVRAHALGTPFLVSASVKWRRPAEYYGGSTWHGTWALDGGGALMNQGVHTVDLLLWLLGDVARVYGSTRTALHAIEAEDTAVACLEFANGAVGTLVAATSVFPGFPRRIELTGSEGTIVVEQDRVVSVQLRTPPPALPPDEGSANTSATSPVVSDVRGHRRVLEDFVAAIRTDATPLCDGHDARRSVELVQAVYRSARAGTPVALRPAGR
jgi:UDP-N-acetyl-2-amino-2-deoxyglucuronate dehydrogenase